MKAKGRTFLVVGASAGIGRGVALELGRRGARVICVSRRQAELAALTDEIRALGAQAEYEVVDTASDAEVSACAARLGAEVDALVFIAGQSHVTMWDRYAVAETRRLFEVNFFGLTRWAEALLPSMLSRGDGLIAGMSALCGYRGIPSGAEYAATKAAMGRFLDGMRLDLKQRGIEVCELLPGFVDTEMARRNNLSQPFTIDVGRASEIVVDGLEAGRPRTEFGRGMARLMRVVRALPEGLYDRVFRAAFIRPRRALEETLLELPEFICPEHRSPLVFDRYSAFECSECDHRIAMKRDHMDLVDGTSLEAKTNEGSEKVKFAYRFYSMIYPVAALFACWFVWQGSVRKQIDYYRASLRRIGKSAEPFVDVATGDGSLLALAMRKVKDRPAFVSIDLSESMLKKASKKLKRVPHKLFYICDIAKANFATASFGHLLCFGGLHVFAELPEALSNMRRMLRPGGTLAGSYLLLPGTPKRDRFTAWCVRVGLLSNRHTEDEFDAIVRAAGFEYADRELNGRMLLFTLKKAAAPASHGEMSRLEDVA